MLRRPFRALPWMRPLPSQSPRPVAYSSKPPLSGIDALLREVAARPKLTIFSQARHWFREEKSQIHRFCRKHSRRILSRQLQWLSSGIGNSTPFRQRMTQALAAATPDEEVIQPAIYSYAGHIPLTKDQLTDRIATLIGPSYKSLRKETAKQFSAFVYQKYHAPLMEIKEFYSRMDPDFDRWYSLDEGQSEERFNKAHRRRERELFTRMEAMLRTANFEELPQALLRQLMQDHVHDEGVRVKVTADDYPLLRIWTRGLHMQRQQVAYRVIETPMYAMVFVAVRVKSQSEPEDIYLKLTKNVPCKQLDGLMPKSSPAMTYFDICMLSAIGMGALGVLLTRAHDYFRLQDPRQELMLVLVCMGLTAIKIHSSYTDRIRRYTMNILHLLHYNSLANNRAALSHVMDMARVERMKALFLTYWCGVAQQSRNEGNAIEVDSIAAIAHEWLMQETNATVDLDTALQCRRLAQMGLLKFQVDGSIVMVPPSEAVEKLRKANEFILGFEASSQTMQEKDSTHPI